MKNNLILLLVSILFAGSAFGAVELKLADKDLKDDRHYTDDYVFTGEFLDFSGKARDLFFFSRELDFSGSTELALNGLAKEVEVRGEVKNGVKAAAQRIDINANVTGTSFLAGERVTIGPDSQFKGDTFIGGRRVFIQGRHQGNLRVGAAEVTIQNEIIGDVEVYAGQLKIPDSGRIVGNLIYHSDHELSADQLARVSGTIRFEQNEEGMFGADLEDRLFEKAIWFPILFKVAFAVCGLLILLFPMARFLENRFDRKELLSHALWGLIPIFVYPSAFVVSILLVITLPLAITLLLAFLPVVLITKILGLTLIGGYLAGVFNLKTTNRYLYFLIAVIPYSLLSAIPIFGILLMIFVTSIGCGLILSRLFNKQLGQ